MNTYCHSNLNGGSIKAFTIICIYDYESKTGIVTALSFCQIT